MKKETTTECKECNGTGNTQRLNNLDLATSPVFDCKYCHGAGYLENQPNPIVNCEPCKSTGKQEQTMEERFNDEFENTYNQALKVIIDFVKGKITETEKKEQIGFLEIKGMDIYRKHVTLATQQARQEERNIYENCVQCTGLRDEFKKKVVELAQDIIPHTPLKIEETDGGSYNTGYIDYQDIVVSNFIDFIKAINQEKL